MNDKQVQKGGDDSTNIQAGTVNIGSSYLEIRAIALDVFRANFAAFAGEAWEEARARAERVTDQFIRSLHERYPEAVENAKQPDMQRALYRVQEEIACSDDKDLAEVLVDMLVDRTSQTGRSLRQLVLNESLITAPKLTLAQLNTLSILFYLRRVQHTWLDPSPPVFDEAVRKLIERHIAPLAGGVASGATDLGHLQYAACLSISMGEIKIGTIFLQRYDGLFSKGWTRDEVPEHLSAAFVVHPSNPTKLVVPVANTQALPAFLNARGLGEYADEVTQLMNLKRMSPDETVEFLCANDGRTAELLRLYDSSQLKNCDLTSVGLAIGHANLRRMTGFSTDLNIWLESPST